MGVSILMAWMFTRELIAIASATSRFEPVGEFWAPQGLGGQEFWLLGALERWQVASGKVLAGQFWRWPAGLASRRRYRRRLR